MFLAKTDSLAESLKLTSFVIGCGMVPYFIKNSYWLFQSFIAFVLSIYMGCFIVQIYGGGDDRATLEHNQESLFIYLLPPIIFNAGFQLQRKQFFLNFLTITSFRVIGSLISFAILSLGATQLFRKFVVEMKDYLAAGAIFCALESVCTFQVLTHEETPLLYSLALGEGVVNDATSVVLFNAITRFNLSDMNPTAALSFGGSFLTLFVYSTFLGIFVGLLCAYIVRTLFYFGRHSTESEVEVALMLLMAYLSYITAEVCNLSGILAVFFCGIVMSHDVWPHKVTQNKSQVTTKRHTFVTVSYIAEVCSFLYVAMDSFDVEKRRFVADSLGQWNGGSGVLVAVLIMVGRLGFILPLSYFSYLTRMTSNGKIGIKQQFIVWWAGLMRGAVSVTLAYKKFTGSGQPIQAANVLLLTSTITVVLSSTVVFGLLTKPIIRMLLPHSDDKTEPLSPTSLNLPLLGSGLDHDHKPEAENGNHATPTTMPSRKMIGL